MEDNIQRLMMPYIALPSTSTRTIPLKLVPPPLGVIAIFFQAHGAASSPPLNAACMMATTFYQFPGLGCSSRFYELSHSLRILSLIPDGPPARCICSRSTASAISSSPGILSSMGKGVASMGIGCPGGGT